MSGGDGRDLGLVLILLRGLKRWHVSDLWRESGVDRDLISDYEAGTKIPRPQTRERLARAFGLRYPFLEKLIPGCRNLRLAYEAAVSHGRVMTVGAAGIDQRMEAKVGSAVMEAMAPHLIRLSSLSARRLPQVEDRSWAEGVWSSLERRTTEEQATFIQVLAGDERSWALAVRACDASIAAAGHNANEALRLARLALHISESMPGPESGRLRLLGYVEPFEANALRVGGDLTAARQAFAHADEHWRQGEGGDPSGLLDPTRRLDLKVSLVINDSQFELAHSLLQEALSGARTNQARGRLLIMKATTFEMAGDYEEALAVLEQAEPLLDMRCEPRLPYVLQVNRAFTQCHLGRYSEVESLLPRIEAMGKDLRNELDGWRVLWLNGRVWSGLGRKEESLSALSQVRQYFLSEKIAYDFALVSLEVAALYLEQGQTREVQDLAKEMLWIFKSQGVHKEALAALALFCQAAQKETAQAEWTRRLVKYLYRAQHNPKLRFDP